MQLAWTKDSRRFFEVDTRDASIKFVCQFQQQFVEAFLNRRVPTSRHPTEWHCVVFSWIISVLPHHSAVELRFFQKIFRHHFPTITEGYILNLNPEFLPVRLHECEIFTNQTEVVFIFAWLQLAPGVGDLRPF